MALKSVTLRLDEEEYEKLKEYLSEFGDPDINVAYVLRSYIRDLNRALPFVKSGWDLKNYFGMLGSWLKQFSSMQDQEMFSKMMVNPWAFWNTQSSQGRGEGEEGTAESRRKASEEKHDKGKGNKA
ncbi:MAG TPA: hypothetical protein VEM15_16120 [Thermodesulfobacteriota bacterium]|nr:hypothetical protein [Thermodesulfobacteriota bacterium]